MLSTHTKTHNIHHTCIHRHTAFTHMPPIHNIHVCSTLICTSYLHIHTRVLTNTTQHRPCMCTLQMHRINKHTHQRYTCKQCSHTYTWTGKHNTQTCMHNTTYQYITRTCCHNTSIHKHINNNNNAHLHDICTSHKHARTTHEYITHAYPTHKHGYTTHARNLWE